MKSTLGTRPHKVSNSHTHTRKGIGLVARSLGLSSTLLGAQQIRQVCSSGRRCRPVVSSEMKAQTAGWCRQQEQSNTSNTRMKTVKHETIIRSLVARSDPLLSARGTAAAGTRRGRKPWQVGQTDKQTHRSRPFPKARARACSATPAGARRQFVSGATFSQLSQAGTNHLYHHHHVVVATQDCLGAIQEPSS